MVLSCETIKKLISENKLIRCGDDDMYYDTKKGRYAKALPYYMAEDGPVGPNGVDIRIGDDFTRIKTESLGYLELSKAKSYIPERIPPLPEGGIFLHSNEFCLATSMEYFTLPDDIMGIVDARSTIGRMGLVIQTATFIQAGYHGRITLELKNVSSVPIRIRPYDVVGQVVFFRLDCATSAPYHGQYQGQDTTTAPGERM